LTDVFQPPSFLPRVIVSLRHPQCLHNVESQTAIRNGIANRESPLTEVGKLQCGITAEYLTREFGAFDAVHCSEYRRTHTIPIAMRLGIPFQVHPHLNERDMGIWHSMLRSEIEQKHPDEWEKLRSRSTHYYDLSPLEGESCANVELRLIEHLSNSVLYEGIDTVLFSGHGMSGLCLRKLLIGESADTWRRWYDAKERFANASVTIYERRGAFYECTLYNHVPWEGKIDPALLVRLEKEA